LLVSVAETNNRKTENKTKQKLKQKQFFLNFKDLHRTGCSLFCGEDAETNQVHKAFLKTNKQTDH
jgi:hypothetical protein